MTTQEDLLHLGQAAATLMNAVASRAKQAADQFLGERAREEAKHRAEVVVEEGRRAAAEVVSVLRKEANALLADLAHLEEALRAGEARPPAQPGARAQGGRKAGGARKVAGARKATGARKVAGAQKATGARKVAGAQKAAGARKGAGGAKAAGARKASPQ